MFGFKCLQIICLILGAGLLNAAITCAKKNEKFKKDEKSSDSPLKLTQHIRSKKIEDAQSMSMVKGLKPDIKSYAGYFTVDDDCDSNIFFWFFPSQKSVEKDPVTLWLQGGPGSSSLLGLFTENGPYDYTVDGKLKTREYSWNKESSVLYLDSPVGTGFSYTKNEDCYCRNETIIADHVVNALEQFFNLFPNLKKNQFFLAGESYAGKYIPAIGNQISQGQTEIKNLAGVIIGNGLIDPVNQSNFSRLFYQLGLVDDDGRDKMEVVEKDLQAAILKENYTDAYKIKNRLFKDIFAERSDFSYFFNFLEAEPPKQGNFSYFLDKDETRKAIHVGNADYIDKSSKVEKALVEDVMRSSVPNLIPVVNNYRTLLFYGQLDLRDPYAACVNFIQNMRWKDNNAYKTAKRYTWYVDDDIAGYGKDAGHLTELLVRNAGHMVATDQPKWAFNMFNNFIHGKSLNTTKSNP